MQAHLGHRGKRGTFSEAGVPVVLFERFLSPSTWINCSTHSVIS